MTIPAIPRLGVNLDHVATLRNARGGSHPDPVRAALAAAQAGADGITVHLREDRRHIGDLDLPRIMAATRLPLNLEMAATDEMTEIACHLSPHAICLVPERRAERTTEGGLDVVGDFARLSRIVPKLAAAGMRVSLFIGPDADQVRAAHQVAAHVVELHTGAYGEAAVGPARADELRRLTEAAKLADEIGLEVHAGHGLTFDNVGSVAALPQVAELNIGHFLVGEALFVGLVAAIQEMRALIAAGRSGQSS
ncbi:MAG: pdxJ [Rhodospirillales bacterium]|nr:pdxJ [Rhodospirillales bacterium]